MVSSLRRGHANFLCIVSIFIIRPEGVKEDSTARVCASI